jgi:predicted homoserine dehydrogenase-like protein
VVHGDATVAPLAGPSCEVVAVAKRDLRAGEVIDGIGGYCAYGLIETHAAARTGNALPIALSEGCTLERDVEKDRVVTFDDVRVPGSRLSDRLWQEQRRLWPASEGSITTAS